MGTITNFSIGDDEMPQPLRKFSNILARETSLSGAAGDQNVLYYGLQFLVYNLFTFTTVTLIAWIMGILPSVLAVYLASITLRIFTGGRHATGPVICFAASVASIIFTGFIAAHLGPLLQTSHLVITAFIVTVFTLWCVLKYSPVLISSKNFGPNRIKGQKKAAVLVTLFWFGITVLHLSATFPLPPGPALAIPAGMLLQDISLLPLSTKKTR